MSCEK